MELFYDDNKKIGIGLIVIGLVFYFLGLLFMLDRGFLAIGNLAFIMGLVILVGPANTVAFFMRKTKMAGSACFFAGFVMIVIGWFGFVFLGFTMQLYGLYLLFRDFIKTIYKTLETMPVIGPALRSMPWVGDAVDYIATDAKGAKGGNAKYDV